jgi:hypothetical protein
MKRMQAKRRLIIVGFILKNISLLKYKDRPPNINIIKAPTVGIIGIFFSVIYEKITAITVAIIKGKIAD